MNFQKWFQMQEVRNPPHLPARYYAEVLEKLKPLEKQFDSLCNFNESTQITTGQDLFHATPFLKEIKNQGFKPKPQTGISTFGSAGARDENTISVTPFYENALKYAKALKLLAKAAQGMVHIDDLPEIFRIYRPYDFYFEPKGDALDYTQFVLRQHGRSFYESLEIANQIVHFLKTGRATLPQMTPEEESEIATVLIKGLGTVTDGRFPWIITQGLKDTMEKFKNLDLNNIGIVTVQVKADQPAEYIKGEQEFRISPENLIIKSVENI